MDVGVMGEKIRDLGIELHPVGMPRGLPALYSLNRLVKITKSLERPDIIQGWEYHGNLAASLVGALVHRSVPVLWNVRHTPYRLRDERPSTALLFRLESILSSHTERILYNSQISRDRHQELGFARDRGIVIPNGFDLTMYKPSSTYYASVREELKLLPDAPLIGLISRYHPMKDHAGFLEAASILSQEFPEVHFLLAGEGVSSQNQELTRLVNDLNLTKQVHLLGEREDIYRLSAALDIATNCSAWGEGFSNAVGEAMACGVPCVVTEIGDSARIVGDTGLVVPPRNPHALAESWFKILKISPEQRWQMGEAARQRITENFSMDRMVSTYKELYNKIFQLSNTGRVLSLRS